MIKLHLKYLLSRFNLLIMGIIIVIYIGGIVLNLLSVPTELTYSEAINSYFYNLVLFVKLVVILWSIYLMASFGSQLNDSYQILIVSDRRGRVRYYLTKIFSSILVIMGFIGILLLISIISGLILTPWYQIQKEHLLFFRDLTLISSFYGLMAYNLVKVLNSVMVIIIPYLIMVIEEAFIGEFLRITTFFFPILVSSCFPYFSYGICHVVLLILVELGIGLSLTYIIDIK